MAKTAATAVKYPVQTLEKALEIIELLAQCKTNSGLGISELSNKLGIGKSTIHRILTTLMAYGYVDQVPNKTNYRLSWRLYEIGSIIPSQRDLVNLDMKVLEELCNRYNEAVNLGIRVNNYVLITAMVEPNVALKANLQVGDREPLYATSLGKVLISEMDPESLKEILSVEGEMFPKIYTPNTISNFDDLLMELKKVREQGYAIDDQEFCIGISCIAMPIRNYNNEIVAALSVTGPSVRINFNKTMEIKEGLAEASQKLSQYLGATKYSLIEAIKE